MNFAAIGGKAVKRLLSLGPCPSSVAGAKTKVSPVAGCRWPSSSGARGGDLAYLGSPASQTSLSDVERSDLWWGAGRFDSAPAQRGTHQDCDFSRGHHLGEQHGKDGPPA